jgi:hypothetical protein
MRLDPAPLSVEDHPLVRDLAWIGFLSGPAGPIEPADGDEPLVWKGTRPLVLLRNRIAERGTVGDLLLINADLEASTAARTPALVVLLERFVERVRGRIERPWAGTFQAEEEIPMPALAMAPGSLPSMPPGRCWGIPSAAPSLIDAQAWLVLGVALQAGQGVQWALGRPPAGAPRFQEPRAVRQSMQPWSSGWPACTRQLIAIWVR